MQRETEICRCAGETLLFTWRGDPMWWSCFDCDGRVRPKTEAEMDAALSTNDRPKTEGT